MNFHVKNYHIFKLFFPLNVQKPLLFGIILKLQLNYFPENISQEI